ncbi:MAG: DHH family phosphoesterase [Oscillospiraceae bacterium]|jgi:phosphoesterase RecJ-like protein|nr:DHH family phosphoesterase [Oscillospiraceae bacterium]
MTVDETLDLLRRHDGFHIITHIRPDGDTIGSAAALCYALRRIGKTAYLYDNPQFGDSYGWAAEPYIAPAGFTPGFTVCVDMADVSLMPEGFKGDADLCIDHHPSNSFYAKNTLLFPEKASCGEIIMALVKALCGLDATAADLLYIAVSTDTGCFVYGNTTGETLQAAAELCFAGARNGYLNKLLFRTSSEARLKLEAQIFSSFRYYHEGRTVISVVTRAMLEKAGAAEKDIQDIAALPGRLAGVFTSVMIRETGKGHCKVSVRTNGVADANKICAQFGGGGHKMAAGCVLECGVGAAAELLAASIAREYQ